MAYDNPAQCRAKPVRDLQEVTMHPQLAALVAAEYVKDMQTQAAAARRVRRARRGRRGRMTVAAAQRARIRHAI